jgi:hypothetical protein
MLGRQDPHDHLASCRRRCDGLRLAGLSNQEKLALLQANATALEHLALLARGEAKEEPARVQLVGALPPGLGTFRGQRS